MITEEQYIGDKRYLELKSIFNKAFRKIYNKIAGDNNTYYIYNEFGFGLDIHKDIIPYMERAYGRCGILDHSFPETVGYKKYRISKRSVSLLVKTNQGSIFEIHDNGSIVMSVKV